MSILADPVKHELTCPLCRRIFTDPLMLDCQHFACHACLRAVHQHMINQPSGSANKHTTIYCPQCGTVTPLGPQGVDGLTRIIKLTELCRRYKENQLPIPPCSLCDDDPLPAVKTCLQCSYHYCKKCIIHCHPARGSFRSHNLVDSNDRIKEGKALAREDAIRRAGGNPIVPGMEHLTPGQRAKVTSIIKYHTTVKTAPHDPFVFPDLRPDTQLKEMLMKVANKDISEEAFTAMKDFTAEQGHLKPGIREKCKRVLSLFLTLLDRGWVSRYNVWYMEQLMAVAHRPDLVQTVKDFTVRTGKNRVYCDYMHVSKKDWQSKIELALRRPIYHFREVDEIKTIMSNRLELPLYNLMNISLEKADQVIMRFLVPHACADKLRENNAWLAEIQAYELKINDENVPVVSPC